MTPAVQGVLLLLCVALAVCQAHAAEPIIQIDAWGADSLRVRIGAAIVNPSIQALLPTPPAPSPTSKNTHAAVRVAAPNGDQSVTNGNLRIAVSTEHGAPKLTATRVSDGAVLLQEQFHSFGPPGKGGAAPFVSAVIQFEANAKEQVYGLGEHRTGKLQNKPIWLEFQRSQVYTYSHGADVTIPFYTSSLGYGFLWNNAGFGSLVMNDTMTQWRSNATQQLDFWVTTTPANMTAGTSPYASLMHRYVDVTGHPPPMPHFASGFWQSKNRYRNQSQVLDIARGYVTRSLPLSVIVIDYYNWVNFGDWAFNPVCWPDPAGMVEDLHSMGVEVMVSVWPQVSPKSFNYEPMVKDDFLTTGDDAQPKIIENGNYLYDSFNPAARDFVFNAVSKGYLQYGIKTYWLDADEPERTLPDESGEYHYHAGQDTEVGMAYPREHQRMASQGLQAAGHALGDFIMLSRSAWAGSAGLGAAMWSGDIQSLFSELAIQVKVAQNVAMSGIYWWTTDIGGYANGDPTSPEFRELIVRWYQFGAFCPLFRTHGHRLGGPPPNECGATNGPNEIWEFGEPAETILAGIMRLRENLRSYVEEHMQIAADTGLPVLRPMFIDFPTDPMCATEDVASQFMFGPDWLVAPVTVYKATNRTVYLPPLPTTPPQVWTHWYTQQQYSGGQTLQDFPAPLDQFPLFKRTIKVTL